MSRGILFKYFCVSVIHTMWAIMKPHLVPNNVIRRNISLFPHVSLTLSFLHRTVLQSCTFTKLIILIKEVVFLFYLGLAVNFHWYCHFTGDRIWDLSNFLP